MTDTNMTRVKEILYQVLLIAVLFCASCSLAFVPKSTSQAIRHRNTALESLPTMIIGPMIKKMRENQAKKKMPMVDDSEARGQAPGLRVGGNAWKWPPIWPYDQNFFTPNEDIKIPNAPSQMNPMQGMLMGGMQAPNPEIVEPGEGTTVETLNEVQYWSVENANTKTDLDEESATRLTRYVPYDISRFMHLKAPLILSRDRSSSPQRHYAFYLQDGMSILEFGAAEESYLPQNMKFSRHVGVSLSGKLMDQNPSLTERLIVNLNNVIEEKGVDSDELKMLASEPFDAVIMANTADFLTHPREVFKSAWQLLKPGGIMIVPFSTRKAYANKFERAQTKVWRDYNDDQHMWVAGSFFQFSAGGGWENLLGFDISPESAKNNLDNNGPLSMFQKGKDNNIYVVQATKAFSDDSIDEENPDKSFNTRMWMLPTMEERDKQLVVPRLGRAYRLTRNPLQKEVIADHIALLPAIYEALIKMDQFSFTFEMQSQLAADLVLDPDFNANEEQIVALKQGKVILKIEALFPGPTTQNFCL
jgi:SAM-dependent methyltransferase